MTWLVVWSSLLFALGLILGARVGIWLEERSARRRRAARREERAAARWLAGVRETRGGTVMPPDRTALVQSPPEVAQEWPAQEPVLYGRRRPRDVREDLGLIDKVLAAAPAQPAAAARDAHVALAVALTETGELCGCRCKNPKGKCGCCDESLIDWYASKEEPETDEEFTARLAGWADDIIAAARTAADPYWDGAL